MEPAPALPRRTALHETLLVLGVSLGASALWAALSLADKLTSQTPLAKQVTTMNSSATPDRSWLDLLHQLTGITLGVVPVLLVLHLLARQHPSPARLIGLDAARPGADLWRGAALAALIGIPGLGLYLGARALGLSTTIAASGLAGAWWVVPVLVLAAAQNALLEEVVMIGYLFERWRALWSVPVVILASALVRGSYHLYQGFGGFVGNLVMGVIFGLVHLRLRRVSTLVVAHTILDVVAFVGYALLASHLAWLT